MTLEEAIKHAEEVVDGHNRIKQIKAVTLEECKCAEEHRQLAEWLKELKQLREQTRWIPVSKRLPEYGTEVLTCDSGGYIEIQSLEDIYDGYWEDQRGDWSDFGEIVAWMPLPKPFEPQEDKEESEE